MRCLDGGPWPPLLEIEADTICIKDKPRKLVFKIDGEVSGEVTGVVDAWWESP